MASSTGSLQHFIRGSLTRICWTAQALPFHIPVTFTPTIFLGARALSHCSRSPPRQLTRPARFLNLSRVSLILFPTGFRLQQFHLPIFLCTSLKKPVLKT